MTVAMYYAAGKHPIPKEWEHDPTLRDNKGMTVAMMHAKRGKIVPKEW